MKKKPFSLTFALPRFTNLTRIGIPIARRGGKVRITNRDVIITEVRKSTGCQLCLATIPKHGLRFKMDGSGVKFCSNCMKDFIKTYKKNMSWSLKQLTMIAENSSKPIPMTKKQIQVISSKALIKQL